MDVIIIHHMTENNDKNNDNPWTQALQSLKRSMSGVDYASNPVQWVKERAGGFPWSKQREIMEAVRDYPRVAVRSCHATGKTFTAAQIVGWWIDSHPPGESFVVTTAPTAPQVKAILWREINKLHARAGLPGQTNLTEWYLGDEVTGEPRELVAFGRKPSEHSEAAFQGIHAKYVLIVFDEASGIPKPLWDAAESMAAGRHCRILAIGNPDITTSEFARVCRSDSTWHTIGVGYQDTPAFTGEKVPDHLLDLLISPEWVESRRESWGEDSALFKAKVAGEFPDEDSDPFRVIPMSYLRACQYIDDDTGVDLGENVAGIDVGGGGDRTVIVKRTGHKITGIQSWDIGDPMQLADRIATLLDEWDISEARIDSAGIGWALTGSIRNKVSGKNIRIRGINFAEKAIRQKQFLNKRAESYWNIRELTRDRKIDISMLDDDALAELTAPRHDYDNRGRIKLEPKDDIKQMLGRSPDIADAVCLSFYDMSSASEGKKASIGKSRKVFDQAASGTGSRLRPAVIGRGGMSSRRSLYQISGLNSGE